MHSLSKGKGRVSYKCITSNFVIDECRITKFFSCYIVNFVKQVSSTSPDHDYFLWEHVKKLVARIPKAVAIMRELPGIFERVRQSLH